MRTARTSLIVLMVVALARLAILHAQLPDIVPSHFDLSGQADGWSARGQFVALFAFLILMMGGTFSCIGWMIRRLPHHMINLPNRDFWLAEERREATIDDLDSRLQWMGLISVALMVLIFEMSARAALTGSEQLPQSIFLATIMGYVAVLSIQTIALLIHYSRTPTD